MARSDVLVTADWAESNLNAPNTVFVEVDEDTSAYDAGHIAGAVKLDWRDDLQDPVKRDFVDAAAVLEAAVSERGIANDDTVVLYGGNNNWFAAYAYWYFKLYGHDDVKLLDGGRKKWELDGRPLSTDAVHRRLDQLHGQAPNNAHPRVPRRGDRGDRRARTSSTSAPPTSSPARSWPRRTCRRSRASGPGHIPCAINVPWSKAANEDGTFKSDDDLQKLYAEAGLDDSKETIAYCRIGERSSHTWFVLQELLGHGNVKNYDGSWTEYGSLVGAPIELGS